MFIPKQTFNSLSKRINVLEFDRDRSKSLVKDLRQTVASLDREIEELASNQRYNRGIPLIEVVRALVAETGKAPEIVKKVPAKIILTPITSAELSSD